jgi:hypothetical protein
MLNGVTVAEDFSAVPKTVYRRRRDLRVCDLSASRECSESPQNAALAVGGRLISSVCCWFLPSIESSGMLPATNLKSLLVDHPLCYSWKGRGAGTRKSVPAVFCVHHFSNTQEFEPELVSTLLKNSVSESGALLQLSDAFAYLESPDSGQLVHSPIEAVRLPRERVRA